MRIYTSIILLSLLTISLSANSQIVANSSSKLLKSVTPSQLLSAVKTGQSGPKSPSGGEQRRDFFQGRQIPAPQIAHRGSGRQEFSWA
ncbi:MAG TPA: hypothetical protein DC064_04190 [Cyanobacteria bacterium UBA9273]|nr:hypothetical protein [Cyanobacteria bacterium UBA9273]